jgi:hypothetical protein
MKLPTTNAFAVLVGGILTGVLAVAAVFGAGGLAILAFRFFIEQVKGGL